LASRKFVRALALDTTPLAESTAYRALWLGDLVSRIGSQMRIVALPWQVFELTDSTVAVGAIGAVELVPLVVFSIWGGAIADRMDRRKMLARTEAGLLITSLALAAVSFGDDPNLAAIYALAGLSSALTALERPPRTAMIPGLVGPEKLTSAIALNQALFQTTQIVAPAAGGALIALLSGVAWIYIIDALTVGGALVALMWVPPAVPASEGESSQLRSIVEGLRWAVANRLIMSLFVIDLVAMIFGMPRAVFPALARDTFDAGPAGAGLLYSAPAVGALIAALSSGWVGRVRRAGGAVILAVAGWGAAITLAGAAVFSFQLTLFFLALAGAADVVSAVFRGTMLQRATPDALRGRVSSVHLMVVTGGPALGDIEAGLLAGAVGAPASVVIGGIACLVGTAVVGAAFPELRRHAFRRVSTQPSPGSEGTVEI
jgi:MFS family permease